MTSPSLHLCVVDFIAAFGLTMQSSEDHLGVRTTPTSSRPYLSTSLRATVMLLCGLKSWPTDKVLRASLSNVLSFQVTNV